MLERKTRYQNIRSRRIFHSCITAESNRELRYCIKFCQKLGDSQIDNLASNTDSN